MLQENLKRANMEKSDIELTKSKLSNIMLGDSSKPDQKTNIATVIPTDSTEKVTSNEVADKTPEEPPEIVNAEKTTDTEVTTETPDNEAPDETPSEAPELPEPPVVVYVKEVGKAGI
jgi:hypothetical protein